MPPSEVCSTRTNRAPTTAKIGSFMSGTLRCGHGLSARSAKAQCYSHCQSGWRTVQEGIRTPAGSLRRRLSFERATSPKRLQAECPLLADTGPMLTTQSGRSDMAGYPRGPKLTKLLAGFGVVQRGQFRNATGIDISNQSLNAEQFGPYKNAVAVYRDSLMKSG